MLSQDAACFYGNHAVVGASAGAVAVEDESGHSVAALIGKNRGILHQNHGLLTTSRHSIDDAAFWFIALERCCQVAVADRGVRREAAACCRTRLRPIA